MTSHKLTPMFLALTALIALASLSFGQVPTTGAFGTANAPLPFNQIEVSDQKPGSILVFPYYTSNAQTRADTRITLTNLMGTLSAVPAVRGGAPQNGSIIVHLFFLRGSDCQQSDQYVCLTKGASISIKASEQDPETTGYLIAVAVDAMGQPISWNALIGNAFVTAGDIVGNYGAEAFAHSGFAGEVAFDGNNDPNLFGMFLDGQAGGYDRPADQFAVEIQSPNDASGQTIVHASVAGNLAAGAMDVIAQSGTGLVIRGDEKQGSFVRFISGNCQSINVINANAPRVPTGLGVFMPKGSIGTVVYNTSNPSVGLLLTPRTNAWSGIRTLHKTRTKASVITIPVFMPVC